MTQRVVTTVTVESVDAQTGRALRTQFTPEELYVDRIAMTVQAQRKQLTLVERRKGYGRRLGLDRREGATDRRRDQLAKLFAPVAR